jgi:hypothetical protein
MVLISPIQISSVRQRASLVDRQKLTRMSGGACPAAVRIDDVIPLEKGRRLAPHPSSTGA